ncbi:MAG: phosphate propanoyltransferase [Candidatus Eisenbacteria bacterium]|nr:phosphate propanoyltransferase [Candidatus Eisenbacteria bacterium]
MERRRPSCHECGYCDNIPRATTRLAESPGLEEKELRDVAQAVLARVRARLSGVPARLVPVAVSARHVHLTKEALEAVYGTGYELSKLRDLSQHGQYAAKETLTVVGTRMRTIEGVRILGPVRSYTQVELARTDGVTLGLELPVRDSGKLSGSSPIVLVGPRGALSLKEGAIRPTRHMHASENEAAVLNLRDGQTVSVRVAGEKGLVFENVIVRTDSSFVLEMHLDTDDANAADVCCDTLLEILDG